MIKPAYLFFICPNFFESFSDAFNIAAGSVTPRRGSMIPIYSTPDDGMEGARHTYVEGEVYDDIFAEIEAMGGGRRNCPFESCSSKPGFIARFQKFHPSRTLDSHCFSYFLN